MPQVTVLRASPPVDVNRQNIVELACSPIVPWQADDGVTNGRIVVCSAKKFLLVDNSTTMFHSPTVSAYRGKSSRIWCMHVLFDVASSTPSI